jgi:hypothetical protein
MECIWGYIHSSTRFFVRNGRNTSTDLSCSRKTSKFVCLLNVYAIAVSSLLEFSNLTGKKPEGKREKNRSATHVRNLCTCACRITHVTLCMTIIIPTSHNCMLLLLLLLSSLSSLLWSTKVYVQNNYKLITKSKK